MNIRLYREDSGTGAAILNDSATAAELADELYDGWCKDRVEATATGCQIWEDSCMLSACAAARHLCVANELMNWVGTEVSVGGISFDGNVWQLPPQSPASTAALAREAFLRSVEAHRVVAARMRDRAENECTFNGITAFSSDSETPLRITESFAATFVESVRIATEASEAQARALTAVADAQYSEQRAIARATRNAFSLELGSRSAAARDQVGGDPGLHASDAINAEGFCPAPRLRPGARQALELFRIAAFPPREILGSRTVDQLLFGWTDPVTELPDGLMRRLAVLLSAPNIDPSLMGATISVDQFLRGFGLRREDFVAAREHLADELRAFGRSLDAKLSPQQITATESTDGKFDLFAATRTPAGSALPTYWTALARYRAVWEVSTADPGHPVVNVDTLDASQPADTNLALLLDAAATQAGALAASGDLDADIRDVIAGFVPEGAARRSARIQFCLYDGQGGNTALRVRAYGDWAGTALALVRGRDGLECHVRGSIDGASCVATDHRLQSANIIAAPSGVGLPLYAQLSVTSFHAVYGETNSPLYSSGARHVAPVFVVARRPGAAGLAGDWVEVAGAFVPLPSSATEIEDFHCDTISIAPEAEQAASALIAPSTGYCAMAAESCAGVSVDQRIPLENELTSDAGGAPSTENSWRHYLDLARQAADHADRLGEDLIRSGLEMDMRAEQAIDELQSICGVSINLDGLGDLGSSIGPTCTTSCTNANHVCVHGQCIVDPVRQVINSASSDADRARLAECLGDEGTTSWVTIGSDPLCFWWDGADGRTICQGAHDAGLECPFVATAATCALSAPELDPPNELELIDSPAVPLAYFRVQEDPPMPTLPSEIVPPCETLSRLRNTSMTRERRRLSDEVMASEFFTDLGRLQLQALRLSWRPAVGDFSEVRLDDSVWFATGSPYERRTTNRWPCVAAPAGLCNETTTENLWESSLFCRQLPTAACPAPLTEMDPHDPYVHTSRVGRARMNDMLARAVIAARVITGTGLRGVQFPYYPRAENYRVMMVDPDSLSICTPHAPPRTPALRTHDATSEPLWSGMGGAVLFDNSGDESCGAMVSLFEMNRAFEIYVDGPATEISASRCEAIPRTAEWSLCPYNLTLGCIEVFDDQVDCDDSDENDGRNIWYDRDLPLVVRAFGDTSNGTDPTAFAAAWTRTRPTGPVEAGLPPHHGAVLRALDDQPGLQVLRLDDRFDLTQYWRRTQCGSSNGCTDITARTAGCHSNLVIPTLGQPGDCRDWVGCRGSYVECQAEAEAGYGLVFDETFDGNRAFIAHTGLTSNDVLNGMELLCAAAMQTSPGGSGCLQAPEVRTVGDLFQAQAFLECKSREIQNGAARAMFRNVPQSAVSILRESSISGAYGNGDGELQAAVSDLRIAFLQLATLSGNASTVLSTMAAEIGGLRARVQSLNVQSEIADWQLASTTMNQVTSCAIAVTEAASVGKFTTGAATAAASCVNSIVQIGIAARVTDLQQEQNELAVREALYTFERNFVGQANALSGADVEVRAAIARIEAAIVRIESLRSRGRRALSRALMLDSDPGDASANGAIGRQYNVNTVLRRRHNTLQVRYAEAHRNAVRLAFIAKLALEQRLGMSLDEMTAPMTLLDAPPSQWHGSLCNMRGIDYDRIRDARPSGTGSRSAEDATLPVPEDYAGEFIGDYVRRLELTFESYSFDYPFQDGTDTTVLSLRDEVLGVRAYCPVEVPNLLYEAGQLQVTGGYSGGGRAGWELLGCEHFATWPPEDPPEAGALADPPPTCGLIEELRLTNDSESAAELMPLPPWHSDFGSTGAYRVHFGQAVDPVWRDSEGEIIRSVEVDSVPARAQREDTALVQWLFLEPGRYRLSFYTRAPDGGPPYRVGPLETLRVTQVRNLTWETSGVTLRGAGDDPVADAPESRGQWQRYYTLFEIDADSWVEVAFTGGGATPLGYRTLDLAAVMLEVVSGEVLGPLDSATVSLNVPRPFFNTSQERTRDLPVCEDHTGNEMRRVGFARHCVGLCPDGYGNCPGALEQHCYYETSFTLGPESLQRGGLLGGAGFAFGNFNYRVDQFGINLVGTNVRTCDAVFSSSACYASGNVPYSVLHVGPYPVRNHIGDLYDAPLYPGRVERARALAAERYLTNPLSGADRSLVEPYLRNELRGRPLTGTYVLRIWDDPGLDWGRVEDVQILLNYRYWTRQE